MIVVIIAIVTNKKKYGNHNDNKDKNNTKNSTKNNTNKDKDKKNKANNNDSYNTMAMRVIAKIVGITWALGFLQRALQGLL